MILAAAHPGCLLLRSPRQADRLMHSPPAATHLRLLHQPLPLVPGRPALLATRLLLAVQRRLHALQLPLLPAQVLLLAPKRGMGARREGHKKAGCRGGLGQASSSAMSCAGQARPRKQGGLETCPALVPPSTRLRIGRRRALLRQLLLQLVDDAVLLDLVPLKPGAVPAGTGGREAAVGERVSGWARVSHPQLLRPASAAASAAASQLPAPSSPSSPHARPLPSPGTCGTEPSPPAAPPPPCPPPPWHRPAPSSPPPAAAAAQPPAAEAA